MTGETILVVEDNDSLRFGICEMLTLEGYVVIEAGDGLEAISAIRSTTPELILSDVMMPEMDGFELYSRVRNQPELIFVPFIFLTARTDPADIMKGRLLGADDYLIKPVTRNELVTAIHSRLVRYAQVKIAQIQLAYRASLTMMADAIESRGPMTIGHTERMVELAIALADRLDWNDHAKNQLRFGTILHDIGKLNVSEKILFKNGPLTPTEWLEIKKHPVAGAEMVRGIPFLSDTAPLIRHHHERWDGQGYPDGLAGEHIPAGARLLTLVDGLDAMTAMRLYAPQLSLDEAQREIYSCSGSQYDPQVVAAFMECFESGKIQQIYAGYRSPV